MYLKPAIAVIKKHFTLSCAIILSCYGLYLRLIKLAHHQLWMDEYFQVGVMNGSFWDMLKAIPAREFGSYLSGDLYLIYPFYKIFGENKWGLAIPHIIITIIGFYFLYKVCQRSFKTAIGYLVTFVIVCFNATMIWHATEIRWYAVLPTLAIACFYFADKLVNEYDLLTRNEKAGIGCLFVLTSWFHLYGILMPYLIVFFFLFSNPRDSSFKIIFSKIFRFMLIIAVIVAPLWLLSVFGPHFKTGAYLNMSAFTYIPNPLEDILGFLKGIFGNLVGNKKLYFLLAGLFFPFFMDGKIRRRQIAFLLILVFLPITLLFAASVRNSYYFVQRQFIWVMPLFAFFLGWAWESLFMKLKHRDTANPR